MKNEKNNFKGNYFLPELLTGSTKKLISGSAKETQLIAAEFARQILQRHNSSQAVVLALQGELGTGKTTFLQGFAKGLGITEKILSPTFVVMKRFELKRKNFKNFYHVDCYRLKSAKDLEVLGLKEIISNPENIVAIERSEKAQKILPKKSVRIKCRHLEKDKREFVIHG